MMLRCLLLFWPSMSIARNRREYFLLFFLQEDLESLETTLPQMKKMTVQLRVTEKRILSGALEYVEQWIKA